jgi:hypothetical protein
MADLLISRINHGTVAGFFLQTRFLAEKAINFVKISAPGSIIKFFKIEGQFRFLYPGTDSNYFLHGSGLYRKGSRYLLKPE